MQPIKKRLSFICWNPNCRREFSLYIEEASEPIIHKICPYCGKENIADLAPYANITPIFKAPPPSLKVLPESRSTTWDFPDLIPTSKPEKF